MERNVRQNIIEYLLKGHFAMSQLACCFLSNGMLQSSTFQFAFSFIQFRIMSNISSVMQQYKCICIIPICKLQHVKRHFAIDQKFQNFRICLYFMKAYSKPYCQLVPPIFRPLGPSCKYHPKPPINSPSKVKNPVRELPSQ